LPAGIDSAAGSLSFITRQVAPAWLLQRSPNILAIAGTLSVEHLHENMEAAARRHSQVTIAGLKGIAAGSENTFRPHCSR